MMKRTKFDLPALAAGLLLALAFRLPGLTVFLTADEARSWFGRALIFSDSLLQGNFANTGPGGTAVFIENVSLSPAPGVTTMWTGALGLLLAYLRQGAPGSLANFVRTVPFDPLNPAILVWLRLPGVLLAVGAVGLTYWWSRPLLGRWGALLAAALLALDPFYLALSRVLGHDAMVTTFMWLSLLAFLRAMESKSESQRVSVHNSSFTIHNSKFLVISGALGGLAFLSKYPALFLGAFVAAAMLVIYWLKPPQKNIAQSAMGGLGVVIGRWLKDISLWSLAAGVVFVLLWPAMWVDPLAPITAILSDALRASGGSHPKGSFFLGQPAPDPGALFYPLVLLLRTTPITFLGLLVAGWGVVGPSKPAQQKVVQPAWVLLAFVLLYTLLVTVGGKKQDRYLLPAFPAMAMLAAIGFTWTGGAFARFTRQPSTLPAVLLVVQLFMVYPYYPYYFSYYNPLAGGGRAAVSLLQVGWGEGLNEAAAYLNSLPAGASGRVTAWYSTTFEPYFNGHAIYKIDDEKISRSPKPGLAADYVVFYINQVQRQLPSAGALQFFRAQPLLHTVTINGIDYAWVYPSVGMAHVFANEARLVGQAELLGYNLSTESGQPVVAIVPESVLRVALYWEWQGKAPTDMLGLSLVDDAGQTRGWGNRIETVAPLPFEQWQDGMVARDDFALVIFADTPPGEYRLAAWIERPDTGETVGVFPLEETITVTPR